MKIKISGVTRKLNNCSLQMSIKSLDIIHARMTIFYNNQDSKNDRKRRERERGKQDG